MKRFFTVKTSSNVYSATSVNILSDITRTSFTINKNSGTDYVESISGWEQDAAKRQYITNEIKKLGFRFDVSSKSWKPHAPTIKIQQIQDIFLKPTIDSTSNHVSPPKQQMPSEVKVDAIGKQKIEVILNSKQDSLLSLLPKGIDPKMFMEDLRLALINTPFVEKSTERAIYTACARCAKFGITPGALHEAYFVARNDNIEFQIGYKGLITLARRVNPRIHIFTDVVREQDEFSYQLGNEPIYTHIPKKNEREDRFKNAYVMLVFTGGRKHLTVVDKEHVEKRRQCSKSINSSTSPWNKFPREMWLKTAIREAFKFVSISPEHNKSQDHKEKVEDFKEFLSYIRDELDQHKTPTSSESVNESEQTTPHRLG